jgi:Ca2+-binding RTX toxin-like protein
MAFQAWFYPAMHQLRRTVSSGDDTVLGNNGDNVIPVTGGRDVIDGGSDEDRLVVDFSATTASVAATSATISSAQGTVNIARSSIEHCTVSTGSGLDTLTFLDGDNIINAGTFGGNTIAVRWGNNTIYSASGIDGIIASNGNIYIDAGEGANTITAGPTGSCNNTIISGSGINTITAGNGSNNIKGGEGANAITTGTGNGVVSSGSAADTAITGTGNDIIKDAGGAGGITAGAAHDRLIMNLSNAGAAATNTVTGAESHGGVLVGTTYSDVEEFHITTGSGNDTLLGGDGADVLAGGAGADNLSGTGASDGIFGAVGDVVDGGEDIDGIDFDILVLKDFGDYRIDFDSPLDPESGTVMQLDSNGNEIGSVAFGVWRYRKYRIHRQYRHHSRGYDAGGGALQPHSDHQRHPVCSWHHDLFGDQF